MDPCGGTSPRRYRGSRPCRSRGSPGRSSGRGRQWHSTGHVVPATPAPAQTRSPGNVLAGTPPACACRVRGALPTEARRRSEARSRSRCVCPARAGRPKRLQRCLGIAGPHRGLAALDSPTSSTEDARALADPCASWRTLARRSSAGSSPAASASGCRRPHASNPPCTTMVRHHRKLGSSAGHGRDELPCARVVNVVAPGVRIAGVQYRSLGASEAMSAPRTAVGGQRPIGAENVPSAPIRG